jgi:hypothetical protein
MPWNWKFRLRACSTGIETPNRLAADVPKAPISFGCTFAMSLSTNRP